MKAPDFYLNNYIADELRAAFDKDDVCISYSGDYEPETLNQVHNSCEILFVVVVAGFPCCVAGIVITQAMVERPLHFAEHGKDAKAAGAMLGFEQSIHAGSSRVA